MTGRRQFGGVTYVCTMDGPLVIPNPDCPNAAEHAPQPRGYTAWWAWADRMAETHDQRECEGCGRWLIVVPKEVVS